MNILVILGDKSLMFLRVLRTGAVTPCFPEHHFTVSSLRSEITSLFGVKYRLMTTQHNKNKFSLRAETGRLTAYYKTFGFVRLGVPL
jgi:hypothetical protein